MLINHLPQKVHSIIIPAQNNPLQSYNCYLLSNGSTLTLIDAAVDSEKSWSLFNKTLPDNGWCIEDIDQVLLTHHHADHIGLLPSILKKKDVPVYAHQEAIPRLKMDVEFLNMRYEFFVQLYTEMDCLDDAKVRLERLALTIQQASELELQTTVSPIAEGDQIAGFTVIETPGHSPDSISFYNAQQNWLFSGDLVLKDSSTNAIIDPDRNGVRIPSVSKQRTSLHFCAELPAEILFTGHQSIIKDHQALIHLKLEKMKRKQNRFAALLKDGNKTARELAIAYYGQLFRSQFSLVMSETIGYLDELQAVGRVEKKLRNGVLVYRLADE